MAKPWYRKPYKFFRNLFFIIIARSVWRSLIIFIKAKLFCKKLEKIAKKQNKPIIIYVSFYDYYYPLIQRPNHIFNLLSDKYPCVMCGERKHITTPKENLFIIPTRYLKWVLSGQFPKIFDISLGFPYKDIKNMNRHITDKTLVFYELIDDFDLLSDKSVIQRAKDMFTDLVKRDKTYVFVTAEHLKNVALQMGANSARIIDNKNAVILSDFDKQVEPNSLIKVLLDKKKPIIGYYGALTSTWFDFDLVLRLVKEHPEYEFVLMGLIYTDKNSTKTNEYLKTLSQYSNFTYVPPVHYTEIPTYAKFWDIATIPFKINDITLSTSPVKLFEYMAMGLPVVTTPMPECKLYKPVFIADGADDFAEKIKMALAKKDDEKYQQILKNEASENTWQKRVEDIVEIIKKYYKE